MKAEILAPAGSQEALEAAFAAGADAVYFALPQFGARAYARNFSMDEARQAIEKAHLAGKKVYITMNTLLEEEQLPAAYEMARHLHQYGVDALIIQDLGLIELLHERLPQLELHASTQLSVSKPWQIEKLKQLGISRVVLAREASLDEIKACARTDMELEVFVHGAICISWSGQCQFSRVRYGRSGNKGACAQPCRMEYTLEEDGRPVSSSQYLLSPKDLSLLSEIDQLEAAGAASLKIEGRMKSPEYVYESVRMAKNMRDHVRVSNEDTKKLKTAFNRGFTQGHTFHKTGQDLMVSKAPNHQGIELGTVLSAANGKVRIKLSEDLHQNDGLRFENRHSQAGCHANFIFDERGKMISSAKAGQIVEVKVKDKVYPGAIVRKTSSFLLEKEVEKAVHDTKIQSPVNFAFYAAPGKDIELEASAFGKTVRVSGAQAQPALKRALDAAAVQKQLEKTGDSFARANSIDCHIEGDVFVPVSALNELRRDALQALEKELLRPREIVEREYMPDLQPVELPRSMIELSRQEQADALTEIDGADLVSEYSLKKEGLIHKASLSQKEGIYGDHLSDSDIALQMNVTNSHALAALLKMGYKGALLSNELSDQGRKDLLKSFKERYGFDAPVIETVYEKPRLMLMNHCPVNTALKDGTRKNCSLCREHVYTMTGKDGKKTSLYGSPACRMQIFDETAVDQIDAIRRLKEEGIHAFRLVLSTENADQTRELSRRFEKILNSCPDSESH